MLASPANRPTSARQPSPTSHQPAPQARERVASAHPLRHSAPRAAEGTISLPRALLRDLRDNLAAIGVYALIARLFIITKEPIPISAGDLADYDIHLTAINAARALRRLVRGGWLLETARPGCKSQFVPTWGTVAGAKRPWDISAPFAGRPRHIPTIEIDRRLLDVYLGRITPHSRHRADIERYVAEPLLALADVGAYARTTSRMPSATPALIARGLIIGTHAMQLPGTDDILAQASQQADLDPDQSLLTDHGLAYLGVHITPPPPSGKPLFFVPPSRIGEVITNLHAHPHEHLIAPPPEEKVLCTASESHKNRTRAQTQIDTRISKESQEIEESTPQPPTPATSATGGGQRDVKHHQELSHDQPSATVVALRKLNVRPKVITELADAPVTVVEAAVRMAYAQPGVRDPAAWVVAAIRDARNHGWHIPSLSVPTVQLESSAESVKKTLGSVMPQEQMLFDVDATVAALAGNATDTSPTAALPPTHAPECKCGDGSGMYVLDVPYGHPLHAKIQRCPCVIRPRVTEHLARAASPALAAAELAAIQIQNRPYTDVQWGRRTFTPAEQQVILHHAVRRAAETAAAAPQKGLTLIGPPGSGKTTIAVSAARELAVRNNLALRFASVPKLLDDIRRESADHTPAALLDKLIDAPVLLLDDIGREKLTAWAREKLFRLLDERMRRHTPEAPRITFLTSNLSFAELYALDSALASRIASNTEVLLCVVSDYRLVTAS